MKEGPDTPAEADPAASALRGPQPRRAGHPEDFPSAGHEPSGIGALPTSVPVSRIGIYLMAGLLVLVLVMGIARNGVVQALGDLGFRNPAVAGYTLMLLSPLFFEAAYPRLVHVTHPKTRRVLDNLHLHAPYLIVIGLVMLIMRLENIFDLDITAAVGWDWTPLVHSIEGDFVARFQAVFRAGWLDLFMRFIYVTVYAFYHVLAIVLFAARGRTTMVKRFTTTWVLIYAIALPFYILAPVNETWTTNPEYRCYSSLEGPYGSFATDTEGVLHDECGDESGIVYAISSINNCFPSLHNAFAWALPLLLWKSGMRRAGAAVGAVAVLISFSTLYLGIHWIIDLVAGIMLAHFVTSFAVRFDYTITHRLRIAPVSWKGRPLRQG